MNTGDRICIICGTKYKYGGNCSDNAVKHETWRNIYCSENCRKIFDVLSAQANGHISDKDAYNEISKLDIKNLESFRDDIKDQIKRITPVTSYSSASDVEETSAPKKSEKFFKPQNKKSIVKDKFE